jgi:hypothetical protein
MLKRKTLMKMIRTLMKRIHLRTRISNNDADQEEHEEEEEASPIIDDYDVFLSS